MMLQYWHWILLALGMVAAEIMVPGAFFLWIGIAACILAGTAFLFPFTDASIQLFLFGIFSILTTVIGRKVVYPFWKGTAPSLLNRRGQQLVGQTITLDVPIVNGHAHITVADSKWLVKGPDLPTSTVVKVVGIEGNTLVVEASDRV
jgi:hypothetical protein